MQPNERRRKERELRTKVRAGAGRLVAVVAYMQTAGRVDAPNVARQLRMAREDVELALDACAGLDPRAVTR